MRATDVVLSDVLAADESEPDVRDIDDFDPPGDDDDGDGDGGGGGDEEPIAGSPLPRSRHPARRNRTPAPRIARHPVFHD